MPPSAPGQRCATVINDDRLWAVLLVAAVLFVVTCWRMLDYGNAARNGQLVYRNGVLSYSEGKVQESIPSTPPCDREIPAHLSQIFFRPVPINSANRELLMILPGIGETMAERIIASRQQQGGFGDISDLARVAGIGPRRLAQLQEHICFD